MFRTMNEMNMGDANSTKFEYKSSIVRCCRCRRASSIIFNSFGSISFTIQLIPLVDAAVTVT